MRLLILGGTQFLGRHLAQQALQAEHAVTLLHRGRSNPTLFPEAEHLIADRDGDLALLAGREFDAVVDTSAYLPRQVRSVAEKLGRHAGHYTLVSTVSVYADLSRSGLTESDAVAVLEDPEIQTVDSATYGGLKALCEQAAVAGFGADRTLLARPGLLVGPHDPTGRFVWWVRRLQRAAIDGDAVLAPGDPADPVQLIDARDAAAWLLQHALLRTTGCFNLTGPLQPTTIGETLQTVIDAVAPAARLQWVDTATLLAHGVQPWTELPLWLPAQSAGGMQVDIGKARASGLLCRPLLQTVADIASIEAPAAADALREGAGPARPTVGLDAGRECELLRTRSPSA